MALEATFDSYRLGSTAFTAWGKDQIKNSQSTGNAVSADSADSVNSANNGRTFGVCVDIIGIVGIVGVVGIAAIIRNAGTVPAPRWRNWQTRQT